MSGLFGASSAQNQDRSTQQQAQGNLGNVFSWALPSGQQDLSKGQQQLGQASNYYQNLLTAGRTDTAQRIAPAVNAAQAGTDAQREQASLFGNRSGGTAAHQAEADSKTNAHIDDMISQALQGGQAQGAAGLAGIGAQEASIGTGLAQLGTGAESSILNASLQSQQVQAQLASAQGEALGGLFGSIFGYLGTK
jgi:hypothetical protein